MSDDYTIPPLRNDQVCAVLALAVRATLIEVAGDDPLRRSTLFAAFLFGLTRDLSEPKHIAGILRVIADGLEPAGAIDRNAIIDACAAAARMPDRIGHEWVKDSLYDAVVARCAAAVLKLKESAAS